MSKVGHISHLEELMFEQGVDGTRIAINFLRDLRNMLAGHTVFPGDFSLKWDGSPAIFVGRDSQSQFISTKAILTGKHTLYRTIGHIEGASILEGLRAKLLAVFPYLMEVEVKENRMYWGDLLYTPDTLSKMDYEGEPHWCIHPNTVMYIIKVDSDTGRKIADNPIGIAWHTPLMYMPEVPPSDYRYNLTNNGWAIGGPSISNLHIPGVWEPGEKFHDLAGTVTLTQDETTEITEMISHAGTIFNQIDGDTLRTIQFDDYLRDRFKQFCNTHIREGRALPEPKRQLFLFQEYLTFWHNREIGKLKTEKGKQRHIDMMDETLTWCKQHRLDIMNIFKLLELLTNAKLMIINHLNKAGETGTFLKTANGLQVTDHEGFVAVDHLYGNTIKLVDRLEFSRANFSPEIIKGWHDAV